MKLGVPARFPILISVTHNVHPPGLVAFCKYFLHQSSAEVPVAWPRSTKGLIAVLQSCRNGPVWRLLSSPCQLGAAPLKHRDAISHTGELFICLFNLIILAEWRYDWQWSNIPTQVDVCATVCARTGVNADNKYTHQPARISVRIRLNTLEAVYRTLSKGTDCSQHARAHRCAHEHSVSCPPSSIFLILFFTRMCLQMWDSIPPRPRYSHIISSILHLPA